MTEYTTSSQAIRDYLSSKERTKHWVRNRIEPPDQCYSPSTAPSILQDPDVIYTAPPSEAGSTHSVPPKMVLRYSDGRPDEPIPLQDLNHPLKRGGSKLDPRESLRSQTMPMPHRSRSGSHGAPRVPEEIRILPSHAVDAPRSAANSHTRSKSLPRNTYSQIQDPIPDMPMPHPSQHNIAMGGAGLHGPLPLPRPGPLVTFSQPPPQAWNTYGPSSSAPHGRRHAPPPIVYAPSHRSRPHYAPPAMYSHPPKMGPNGMIYSHSAPVPSSQYPAKYPTPYPSAVASSAHMSSVNEERRSGSRTPNRRDRSGSRTARQLSPASSTSSFTGSNGSGSTYYVMPTGRQKVHVIVSRSPSVAVSVISPRTNSAPQHTDASASSASHSPTSPRSMKKPFFQRLLGFAEKRLFSSSGDSSRGSSRGGRRLRRRHSTGGSGSGRINSLREVVK
ncbi:hypothetical protein DFH09DRAFT_1263838 [Mycena vulgaris]|nr:hypothetical protein DFH09DRAFT_1263838 [Mycena vulgaris]